MRSFLKQHLAGIVGQVAAALPLLLVTVTIARLETLADAGRFTVVVGLSAAAFSTALWGLRTSILLDRFREFSPADYARTRAASIVLATTITAAGAAWMRLDWWILLAIVLLRASDALVDLLMASLQVLAGTGRALGWFAGLHLAKLTLVTFALVVGLFIERDFTYPLICVAGFVSLGGAAQVVRRRVFLPTQVRESVGLARIWRIIVRARWYAAAAVMCSVLTSAPRVIVAKLYEGDLMGVAGVSLSLSTFFGMVYFTIWARNLPRFESTRGGPRVVGLYLIEWVGVGLALGIVSWFVLPPMAGWIFMFQGAEQQELSRSVLFSGVVFAAGMTLANLYKVTSTPWREVLTYVLPFPVAGMALLFAPWTRNIPSLLWIAGSTMSVSAIPAIVLLVRTHGRPNERDGSE